MGLVYYELYGCQNPDPLNLSLARICLNSHFSRICLDFRVRQSDFVHTRERDRDVVASST